MPVDSTLNSCFAEMFFFLLTDLIFDVLTHLALHFISCLKERIHGIPTRNTKPSISQGAETVFRQNTKHVVVFEYKSNNMEDVFWRVVLVGSEIWRVGSQKMDVFHRILLIDGKN